MKLISVFKVLIVLLSWTIPLPDKSKHQMMTCSKEGSALVRGLFASKWVPVFDKFKVSIPLECPFHHSRDIFHLFNRAKVQRTNSHWQCSFCGKIFVTEHQLEYHLSSKHVEDLPWIDDSVCLADFCDIFRCDVHDAVLKMKMTNESSITIPNGPSTTALVRTGPRNLVPCVHLPWGTRYPSCVATNTKSLTDKPTSAYDVESVVTIPSSPSRFTYVRSENISAPASCNSSLSQYGNANTSRSSKSRGIDLLINRLRAHQHNCDQAEMAKIRSKCEQVVHSCIAGLLLNMTNLEFVHMEADLNRAVCWYLHCDRYWQEVWYHENPPSEGLVLLVLLVSFFGAGFCISYCIVCVLCDDSVTALVNNCTERPAMSSRAPSSKAYSVSNRVTPGTDLGCVEEEDFDCGLNCKHSFNHTNIYDVTEDENSIV